MLSYPFNANTEFDGLLPETVTVKDGVFQGTLSPTLSEQWKIPPHVAFANLSLEDEDAVADFTKEYGPLAETSSRYTGNVPRKLARMKVALGERGEQLVRRWPNEPVDNTFSFSLD